MEHLSATRSIPEERLQIRADQVQQLYGNALAGMIATLVNAPVLAYVQWNVVSHRATVLWLLSLLVLTLLRLAQLYRYRHSSPTVTEAPAWGSWFIFGLGCSGIAWGSAALFLFPASSTTHQVFLAFVLGGMVAGAAGAYSVFMTAFLAYSIPALVPLIIRFFLINDKIHIAMGGMTILFGILILGVALRLHAMAATSLRLRFANNNLLSFLAAQKDGAEKLNEELLFEITERKNAERELRNHRKHLEERVRERTAELSEANARLEKEIDARREAEESLRRSEDYFRSLIENALDLITVIDKNGTIFFESPSVEKLLGYRREDLIGKDVFAYVHAEDRAMAQEALARIVMTPGVSKSVELRIRHENGSWRFFEANAKSIVRPSQELLIIVNSRDMTERKKLEEDILKAQKLDSVGTLAGGIAHDFNNLITGITANIELAKMRMHRQDEEYAVLTKAEEASRRAHELTQQLLTFSHGGDPVKKSVRIQDLIQEAAHFALRGSKAACTFSLPGDTGPVEVDAAQLRQVIQNIVMNADQAMPAGGMVRIACTQLRLGVQEVQPLEPGEYVKVSIADQGIGIPREYFSKIFDPYFTTRQAASGLGLATAYSIIKKHGGSITVESEPGAGSVFAVYLPLKDGTVKTVENKCLILGTGRVLIMDDEEIVRDAAGKILIASGYEVELAEDGDEAVTRYMKAREAGKPFDVIIIDLTVPGGMGGKDAMQRLLALDPRVKAIVSSGYSHDPIMANYREYGFMGVIAKPYRIREMSEIVRNVMMDKPAKSI